MTTEPTNPPERPAPKRTPSKKRMAVERRLYEHLQRIADPELTNDVRRLLHMMRVEAAHWRHRHRNATAGNTDAETE